MRQRDQMMRRRRANARFVHSLTAAAALLILWTAPCPRAGAVEKKTTTDILVLTAPEKATVYCDGTAQGISPATIAATPGAHLVVVRKQNYVEERRTVTVEPGGPPVTVEIKLEAETGLVLLHSQPSGAEVIVNDASKGATPLLITDLPLGDYRVRLSKPGYSTVEKVFTVAGRVPMKVEVVLPSDSGTITFTSEPPGAEVTINGVSVGQTPCTAKEVKPGNAAIEIRKEGFQPHKKTVKVTAGETLDIAAPLEVSPGALVVHSMPEGALVYVNNERRGNTPLTIENLPPGDCRVRVELSGYEPLARDVTINQSSQTIEEFRLELNTGVIELRTRPSGVRVFVDDQEMGTTTPDLKDAETSSDTYRISGLAPGQHVLKLSKPGFETKTINADVVKGVVAKLAARLRQRVVLRTGAGREETFTGYVEERFDNGDIKLEVRQGVIRAFKKDDIRSCEPASEGAP